MSLAGIFPDSLPRSAEVWRQLTHPVTTQDYVMAGIYILVALFVLSWIKRIFSNGDY